jgi:SAM-dependent methyltransferase
MVSTSDPIAEYGKQIDFGKTADDYGRYRAGFPEQFYRRLETFGVGLERQRVLDLGTGTGFLGRGFAQRGCLVTGLDISAALMQEAHRLDAAEGTAMGYVRARAETLPLTDGGFDVVSAGQCWHWFDRLRAAREARRVLVSGGLLVIASFDWIALPGNVVEATEQLILKHNPKWALAGGVGIHPVFARDACDRRLRRYRMLQLRRISAIQSRSVARADSRERRGCREPWPTRGRALRRRVARDAGAAFPGAPTSRASDARASSRFRGDRSRSAGLAARYGLNALSGQFRQWLAKLGG